MSEPGAGDRGAGDPGGGAVRLDRGALEKLRALNRPGDPDIVPLLVEAFRADGARQLEEMRVRIDAGDCDGVRRTAHSFKSSAANLGAMRLSELCRRLEDAGRAGRIDEVHSLAALVGSELGEVLALLDEP